MLSCLSCWACDFPGTRQPRTCPRLPHSSRASGPPPPDAGSKHTADVAPSASCAFKNSLFIFLPRGASEATAGSETWCDGSWGWGQTASPRGSEQEPGPGAREAGAGRPEQTRHERPGSCAPVRPDKSRASRYRGGGPGVPVPQGKEKTATALARPEPRGPSSRPQPGVGPRGHWGGGPAPARCTWGSLGCGCRAGALRTWGHPRGAPCSGLTRGEPGSPPGVSPRLPATRPSRVRRGGKAAVAPALCRVAGTAPRGHRPPAFMARAPQTGRPRGAEGRAPRPSGACGGFPAGWDASPGLRSGGGSPGRLTAAALVRSAHRHVPQAGPVGRAFPADGQEPRSLKACFLLPLPAFYCVEIG